MEFLVPANAKADLKPVSWQERTATREEEIKKRSAVNSVQTILRFKSERGEISSNEAIKGVFQDILRTLKADTDYTLVISKDDKFECQTIPDAKTLFFSAGFVDLYNTFLKSQGKKMNKGHLAFIIAHELSHWDPEAETFHLDERYCDTNGIKMATKHYSNEDLKDGLAFLEWLRDKNTKETGYEGLGISITHPTEENRRILGEIIMNDPAQYMPGAYIDGDPIDESVLDTFLGESKEFVDAKEKRFAISSDSEVEQRIAEIETLSQAFEVYHGIELFYICRLVKTLAEAPQFQNLLVAHALTQLEEETDSEYFSDSDSQKIGDSNIFFYALQGAKLDPEVCLPLSEKKPGFSTQRVKNRVIQQALECELKDPIEILTDKNLVNKNPIFSGNIFFQRVTEYINNYMYPGYDTRSRTPNDEEKIYSIRANALSLTDYLPVEEYLFKNNDDDPTDSSKIGPESVAERRTKFLHDYKYFLAAEMLFNKSNNSKEIKRALSEILPASFDFTNITKLMTTALVDKGIVKTQDLAQDLVTIMVNGGVLSQQNDILFPVDSGLPGRFMAFNGSNPEVFDDVKNVLNHLYLSMSCGSDDTSHVYDSSNYASTLSSSLQQFYSVAAGQAVFDHSTFPVDLLEFFAHQDLYLDLNGRIKVVTPIKQMDSDGGPFSITDLGLLKSIYLERMKDANMFSHKENVGIEHEIFNDESIKSNIAFVEDVLTTGINDGILSPKQVLAVLQQVKSLKLYRTFMPYCNDLYNSNFYLTWFDTEVPMEELSVTDAKKALIEYINAGGLVYIVVSKNLYSNTTDDPEMYVSKDLVFFSSQANSKRISFGTAKDSEEIAKYTSGTDRVFTYADLNEIATALEIYLSSDVCNHSIEAKMNMADSIANIRLLTMGDNDTTPNMNERDRIIAEYLQLISTLSQEDTLKTLIKNYNIEISDENVETLDKVIELYFKQKKLKRELEILAMLPESNVRDTRVLDVARSYKNISELSRFLPYLSELFITGGDFDESNRLLRSNTGAKNFFSVLSNGLVRGIPLKPDPIDIHDYVPMVASRTTSAIGDNSAFMLFRNELIRSPIDMSGKIDLCIKAFPEPSGIRDFMLEVLLTHANESGPDSLSLSNLEKMSLIAKTQRFREQLSIRLFREYSKKWNDETSFSEKWALLSKLFPDQSSVRDSLIKSILDNSVTTWEEIDKATDSIMGYNYRTDKVEYKVKNAMYEFISTAIEKMKLDERLDIMKFAVDELVHIFDTDSLTIDFFTSEITNRLKSFITRKYVYVAKFNTVTTEEKYKDKIRRDGLGNNDVDIHISDIDFETNKAIIIQYLLAKAKNDIDTQAKLAKDIDPTLLKIINLVSRNKLLSFATPVDGVLGKLAYFYTNNDDIALNSLGDLFLGGDPVIRRQLIYNICLGAEGILEDENFVKTGESLFKHYIDICAKNNWSEPEKQKILTIVKTFFKYLKPTERAELLSRTIDTFTESGGKITREQLIYLGLSAFRGLGPKLAQLDELWPPEIVRSLASLKERVSPIPKPVIAQVVRSSGRDREYIGLGKNYKGGSTASVITGNRRDGSEAILKTIRPDVITHLDHDMDSLSATLRELREQGLISVDLGPLLLSLKQVVKQELNPSFEAAHTKLFEVVNKSTGYDILVPQIIFTGQHHLEMSKAKGMSLQEFLQKREIALQKKQSTGSVLTNEEMEILAIDMNKVNERIVGNFMSLAFKKGIFHTDLHTANIFIEPQGVNALLTQIDNAQIGIEDDVEKRRTLALFTLGMFTQFAPLIASALHTYDPSISTHEVYEKLKAGTNFELTLPQIISELTSNSSVQSLVKGIGSIAENMRGLKPEQILRLLMPYIVNEGNLEAILHATPLMFVQKIGALTQ